MDALKSRIGPGPSPGRRTGGGQMEEDKSVELNEEGVESRGCLGGGRAGAAVVVVVGVVVVVVLADFLSCLASCL